VSTNASKVAAANVVIMGAGGTVEYFGEEILHLSSVLLVESSTGRECSGNCSSAPTRLHSRRRPWELIQYS
jgi:hypothetical protein